MTKVFRDGVPIDCEVAGAPPMTADPKPDDKGLEDFIPTFAFKRPCEKVYETYVLYDDYLALKAENSALREFVELVLSHSNDPYVIQKAKALAGQRGKNDAG